MKPSGTVAPVAEALAGGLGGAPASADTAPAPADPYVYRQSALHDPDWRRLPGFRGVTPGEWRDARWQRANSVKDVAGLENVFGSYVSESLCRSVAGDQEQTSTMSILLTPQILNTMDESDLWHDPIRRYMLPARADRHPVWPNHPVAQRDSLHEAEMWTREGLTHRYPTKVLAELVTTCPQYCGHCTRMDLVGRDVPQVLKLRFSHDRSSRLTQILDYVRETTTVRDVVVSGGDVANVPVGVLSGFVTELAEIPHVKDIRLASKALMGLPQHYLRTDVLRAFEAVVRHARSHGTEIAIHTHINHARSVTPLVAEATARLVDVGFRHVRNQGVLLRGTNDSQEALLDLCFTLIDNLAIEPYYFYMCDLVPNSEHWRLALHEAQSLQDAIIGYLPGFSTPRIVCDVPLLGKKWVHQVSTYDAVYGISYWTKAYLTTLERRSGEAENAYTYFDPIYTLPEEGRAYWDAAARCPGGDRA